ncbi:MAG: hypothetical protein ACYC7D_15745 [Nitrososphaerales archaeon]
MLTYYRRRSTKLAMAFIKRFLIILAIIFLILLISYFNVPSLLSPSQTSTTTLNIQTGLLSIAPSRFMYIKMNIDPNTHKAFVVGNFTSTGSTGDNAIRVFLVNQTEFQTFQSSGQANESVFSTGEISSGTINAQIPQGGGQYYLLFDNSFDSSTAKSVNATVNLLYY